MGPVLLKDLLGTAESCDGEEERPRCTVKGEDRVRRKVFSVDYVSV